MPKNYRPVALTSHLIKVFERVLRKGLVTHIERLGLLPDGQHGSRAMRSTLTQLLSHWDSILDGLERGEGVDAVYLDFSKAFDKVETGVLLHKLRDSKVLGKVGCWLGAFLPQAASCCGGRKTVFPLPCYQWSATGNSIGANIVPHPHL